MTSSKRPACLAGQAGTVTGTADALLALELTLDVDQRLTRPAAHDEIPHTNRQTSARALPLNSRHARPGPASASDPNGTGQEAGSAHENGKGKTVERMRILVIGLAGLQALGLAA